MIRVGFIITANDGWLGGLNYFRNLLWAIQETKNTVLQPVIFTGNKASSDLFRNFPPVDIIRTSLLDRLHPRWLFGKLVVRCFDYDHCLEKLLRKHSINILSHYKGIGENSAIPSVGWIPDFQHRHLPHFFSPKEYQAREEEFVKICKFSTKILVSSADAYKDLAKFFPLVLSKARILRFVVDVPGVNNELDFAALSKKYALQSPYYYVPNQFWVHKNHRILVEALNILKLQNRKVRVIASGNTSDYRCPHYFAELMDLAKQYGLQEYFNVLGIIPYPDVVAFMRNARAIINPSLFEGWSTTVEEAKSLGKRIILSDIPVHREQNPDGGVFFEPTNAEALAEALWEVWSDNNLGFHETLVQKASMELPLRRKDFAETYEGIILEACSR